MNPFQMSEEAITKEIKTHLVPELPSTTVDEVHFYGAGCTKEKQPVVERALRANLTITNECEVASDMLGAARGICGHKPRIACILGTGKNSCSYDGKQTREERLAARLHPRRRGQPVPCSASSWWATC